MEGKLFILTILNEITSFLALLQSKGFLSWHLFNIGARYEPLLYIQKFTCFALCLFIQKTKKIYFLSLNTYVLLKNLQNRKN